MKSFRYVFLSVLALSVCSFASEVQNGGDRLLKNNSVYFGGAYAGENASYVANEQKITDKSPKLMLQSGYRINDFIAFEGRYWTKEDLVLNEDNNRMSVQAWGVYLRSSLPFNGFSLYSLMGFGDIDVRVDNKEFLEKLSKVQWGGGLSLEVTDRGEVYMDCVNFYDEGDGVESLKLQKVNFGFLYTF